MEQLTPVLVVAAIALVAAGGWSWHQQHQRALEAGIARLIARHDGWHRQAWPAGVQPELLVGRFAATPRGDRRYGIERALGGPLQVELAGREETCEVACLRWYHERRRTQRSSGRTRTRYERRTDLLVLCQLPVHTHRKVSITPESVFGRIGLTRGGTQVESEEFNRRFRVEGRDSTLLIRLLDAQLQAELLEGFVGRTIELSDDLLVLAGEPDHRDATLPRALAAYPALLEDLRRLLRAVPASFWRALGHQPEGR